MTNPRTKHRAQAQELGVSQRALQRIDALNRNACPELLRAAHAGLLAPKHAEIISRALNHHDQRQLLAALPAMSPRIRHETISVLRSHLQTMHHTPRWSPAQALALNGGVL